MKRYRFKAPKVHDFENRLSKMKEIMKININLEKIEKKQLDTKNTIKNSKKQIETIVHFRVSLDNFISNRKNFFESFQRFNGAFRVEDPKNVDAAIKEFL